MIGVEMARRISHFSCGAASAISTKLSKPDEIWYAKTGSEDEDNDRFFNDCEQWFDQKIKVIKSDKYNSTWEVWEKRKYLAGIQGAPCTGELKILPRLANQLDDDVHIFGYTSDKNDVLRAKKMGSNWPELSTEFPLIEKGITKTACLALLQSVGIVPPRTYELGFPNANCIPCVKATSPNYWSLVRKHYPEQFKRMMDLEKQIGAKLTRINGERCQISEIPKNHPTIDPIAPACDFLCGLAEQDLMDEVEK